jgi:hypothetical protein
MVQMALQAVESDIAKLKQITDGINNKSIANEVKIVGVKKKRLLLISIHMRRISTDLMPNV